MRRGTRLFTVVGAVLLAFAFFASAAQACPMCSQSIAEEDLAPHAYMYSILFMLGMPATVFAGFGTMIYLKFRKFYAPKRPHAAVEEAREPELAAQT